MIRHVPFVREKLEVIRHVQRDLARAGVCVRSARCFMDAAIDDVWKVVAAGGEVAIEQRATLGLAAVDGLQRAVEAD